MKTEANEKTVGHTAGPWKIGAEYGRAQDEVECADGRTVAIVWTRSGPKNGGPRESFNENPELQANARLIASAPELLEALKAIVSNLTEQHTKGGCYYTIGHVHILAARAAIAKAEGTKC